MSSKHGRFVAALIVITISVTCALVTPFPRRSTIQVTPNRARLAVVASGAVTRGARRVACGFGDALVGTSVRFGAHLVGRAMVIGRALVAVVVQRPNSVV